MDGGNKLSRNVWVTSATSFLTDVSSKMVTYLLPLFLANVVGVGTVTIGFIEGVAESTASLVKLVAGSLSDRYQARKSLAVAGYALSAAARPFFYVATTWPVVAGVRWVDRVGKGIRTAPRDALLADSAAAAQRGLAFGLHRAADTGGAVVGLLAAIFIVSTVQGGGVSLQSATFRTLVLASLVPGFLAVAVLAFGARDVPLAGPAAARRRRGIAGLGRPFAAFLLASAVFDLGNSSDAFMILRAQERGLSVVGVLWTLLGFNLVYALVSTPAGALSDRLQRKTVLLAGWILYAAIYLGLALADSSVHVVILFILYGAYYGLVAGSAKALIADLVEPSRRATAYGAYHGLLGFTNLPASLLAGVLWQGVGPWTGFGPRAPFVFGATMAAIAAILLALSVSDDSAIQEGTVA